MCLLEDVYMHRVADLCIRAIDLAKENSDLSDLEKVLLNKFKVVLFSSSV